MLYSRFVKLQRAGIAKCSLVEYAIPGLLPEGDAILADIGVTEERRRSFMLTDIERLPSRRASGDGTLRIFCATRLQWKRAAAGSNVSSLDVKGTDVMFQGLHMFLNQVARAVQIRVVSFGTDAVAARRYVDELGLTSHMQWLPPLTQAEFLEELAQADVVLENFGGESCLGMAGRDAIAMGIPVIASGKSDVFERVLGDRLPIYEAGTPVEICNRLNEIT